MIQKQRIYTKIGKDQKVTVELNQNFDLLEVLSLKFSQKDVYTSLCADYGVVCGRISVNNGLGVPNARVSIFVPLSPDDYDDPVISALYPYKQITDKDDNHMRYNLLPARQQHGGHEPTGTFPDQLDILGREEVLEVYEKYYKYTVKTNIAGDFMIWGVPLGEQILHVDLDLSDIGCFSLRPDDFIRRGHGIDEFKSTYQFKASGDVDSLPQIKSYNKTIEVYPFWGNEDLCKIAVTRVDFDLADQGVVIEPKALIIGGSFTDTGKNSIDKNCIPVKSMGSKCTLTTNNGKIEAIRYTTKYDSQHRPILEFYNLHEDINDDGSFAFSVPMNMDYLYTNEFGENEYTTDPNKGVPTASCYRFRFGLKDGKLERVRMRGYYLAPNIREYTDSTSESDKSYYFGTDYSGYPTNAQSLLLNSSDGFYYPQDYFYRFQYGKVYTVSSFQGSHAKFGWLTKNRFLGIKEIVPAEEKDCRESVLTPPTNFATKNNGFNFTMILATVQTFIKYVFSLLQITGNEFLGSFFVSAYDAFNFKIAGWRPLGKVADQMLNAAYQTQAGGQLVIPLTIYDECELCTTDDTALTTGVLDNANFCKIGELRFDVYHNTGNSTTYFAINGSPREDNTIGTSDFNSSSGQRDCGTDASISGCCSSYLMSTGGYSGMNTSLGGTDNGPRFVINISGNSGSSLNPGIFYISSASGDSEYPLVTFGTGAGSSYSGRTGFQFTDTQMLNLFGYDYTQPNDPITGVSSYVVDRNFPKGGYLPFTGVTIEEGCAMYDTLYDESIIKELLWFQGSTIYGDPYLPAVSAKLDGTNAPGIKEIAVTDPSNLKGNSPGTNWTIGASVFYESGQQRLPKSATFSRIPTQQYDRKTKTGYSEFRDGVFTIVPSINGLSKVNRKALREWYRRQLVGIKFCGGVTNYSFIDNWLSGSLYFFQFKAKLRRRNRIAKVCTDIVKYIYDPVYVKDTNSNEYIKQSNGRFYYKSAPYNFNLNRWGGSNNKLLHPTTFVDLGPRDEFIKEICVDPSLDPNCSVSRGIGPSSYKNFGELMAFAINYRMDSSNDSIGVDEFFRNRGFTSYFGGIEVLSGDVLQLISTNNEAGIDGFTMENSKYLGYSISTLDPEDNKAYFQRNGIYGPTPITLQYEDDGIRIRECLNAPGYLTESSQRVPFYLWDKKGTGFGPYDGNQSSQAWDYSSVHVDYLQGQTYGYKFTGSTTNVSDAYLLPPMSFNYSGVTITGMDVGLAEEFNVTIMTNDPIYSGITGTDTVRDNAMKATYDKQPNGFTLLIGTSGTEIDPGDGRLYIRLGDAGQWTGPISWDTAMDYSIYPTVDPYNGNKQILSTPFMFYFGLRPGKTGMDKLIERFGPKGAFPTVN
jgi:hypothetical protein